MSSTPNVIWDDQPKPPPVSATAPQIQWDDETPNQPVKPTPAQLTQPQTPQMPPAIAAQVAVAKPNIAQYPENQPKPDADYVTRKNAFEAVQGEPGAPQDFQYDPEQERLIKAQEQIAGGSSFVPQAAMPALAAAQKYAIDPFEKMSKATAQYGREVGEAEVSQPAESSEFITPDPRALGIARGAGSVVGGVAGDPRMWPLFFMGPEASAAKTAMSAGFATQMGAGAYEQAGELGKIMDNPDVPQEDKWEAGANMVLSTLMAAQAGSHPAVEAVKARLGEFQKLPPADQEQIRNVLRQRAPEIAAEVDKAAGAEQAAPKVTWDDEEKPAAKPERFRLPRGTSAAEVQGEVKGPNIRTVQVGDKTYAFDQRKTNADGVTSAVERNELWRLTGGKAPEAAKVQAEADVRGEETAAAEAKPVEHAAPEVKWDDEAAKPEAQTSAKKLPDYITENRGRWFTPDENMARGYSRGGAMYAVDVPKEVAKQSEETRVPGRPEHILIDAWKNKARPVDELGQKPEGTVRLFRGEAPHEDEAKPQSAAPAQPERRTDLATRKRVADLTPDERSHELLTSELTKLPNKRAFEEDSHTLAQSYPHVGYADIDDFKRYNDALGHEGVDKAVLPAIGDLFRDASAKEPDGSVKVYHRSGDEFNFRSATPEAIKRVTERVNKELAETTFKYQTKDGRILEKKGTGLSHGIGTDHESAEENSHADKQRRKELGLREGSRDVPAVDTRSAAGEQTAVRENTERERVPGKSERPAEEVKPRIPAPEAAGRPAGSEETGRAENKADLNAPKSERVIPPDVTAKADLSGKTVPAKTPTFFSKAEQVAEEKLPDSVKAGQVIPTLQNAGVKADELKWLGLDDYLEGKDKVPKADLLEHIRQNNLQVKEVMNGGEVPLSFEQHGNMLTTPGGEFKIEPLPNGKYRMSSTGSGSSKTFDTLEEAKNKVQAWRRNRGLDRNNTKFENYQLPGGENYRELLLTLPQGKTFDQIATEKGYGGWNSRLTDEHKADVEKTYDAQRMKATGFKSGHFDEPNVLAHVRFNDRISPDGKKTLFLEELQSDWHQKGRKEGYIGRTPEERESQIAANGGVTPNAVPDAPFKSTWHELAMKRMLRYAAENGYDQLAWTTGEQQAARYDLSKQISRIEYSNGRYGDNLLKAHDHGGTAVISKPVPPNELPDVIGKEAADKLLAKSEEKTKDGTVRSIAGLDLKVGGQGMKGFYDKILPDFLNKYGKKWGAKVGETQIPSGSSDKRVLDTILREDFGTDWGNATPEQRQKAADIQDGKAKPVKVPVHSIPITPAMRHEVVFSGQPLYAGIDPIAASRAIVQTVKDANGIIKKGSDLYHGAVDKALDWAHMGQTRPEIRQFDPDAADLATKMDAGGQYHKAVAEMIGKKVTGPLTETFDKADNYASRQKKNEISRDRMKGFHFLADAQNREWLEENHPEDFHRWNADPKIKEALDAYKPFEEDLRAAAKQLGNKTIDEDYIKRIMDFATSGVAYEKGLAHGVEGPVELRQGAAAGARGGGRDNVVSPQIDRSKARKDAGKYYWDHGVFDFGPSFEKRWVEVMSKLDEHRLAVHSMSVGTRMMPDEAMPEKVFYNGQEFYRADIAKEIREVQKRGVSAESKALADALGVSELPTPKEVREYANYEPLRRGSRFETAARNLAANVLAGKEGLETQAANVNRMAKLRYALPKEIVDALNDAGREKELGAASKLAQKVLGPLTQFIRQQIVGLGYGVPHMANILRKVVQAQPGAALNPLAWINGFKVAFSKELKARGISGTEDPTYDMLLRNAAISEGAVPEYKHYIEGNLNPTSWEGLQEATKTAGNAFRKGGREGAKVTPLSAAAGLGRLAIEPLNRFSEAGHANLFKPGGIDQRARLWLGDFLKDRYPGMNEQRIAHEVNQTLGRYNRASWTDVQRNLGPLMLFPGWDYSSMAFALKHPFKTAVAPAVLMLLANTAVHSIGGNKNDEKNDLERVHVGKYSIRTNLFNDNMGTHMWGWALRGAKAGLDHKNAKQATGEIVKGIPGDVAGVTTGTMNPIISTPIQVGANRVSPGRAEEIAKTGDFKKKGKILPNKAAEDYADFAARRAFPIYDRATQTGQRLSLASFAGLAGVSVTEKKKKNR